MATVKTVVDPRVVDEQGVVLNQYVGPLNWEHYKIPASGLSNTQITFANIVTLGTNRLYDSNFEIEYTIDIKFDTSQAAGISGVTNVNYIDTNIRFQPFPLHSVTDQLRTNINGAACMSRPQESLLQRMMFWRQAVLDKTCSHCPHDKFTLVDEPLFQWADQEFGTYAGYDPIDTNLIKFVTDYKGSGRSLGKHVPCVNSSWNKTTATYTITIREPVLCPPFNQRLDKLYQRPLFNITSIDMVYQLNDLRRMLLPWTMSVIAKNSDTSQPDSDLRIETLNLSARPGVCQINIKSAQLCFNVASLPPGMTVPPAMTLPYYDNVNYVTAYPGTSYTESEPITSGVYTLAQVPTAIYIFVSEDQLFRSTVKSDTFDLTDSNQTLNPSFCPIRDINITIGNNTQLLTTTSEIDRYRMCLANGLENTSWEDFTQACQMPYRVYTSEAKNRFYKHGGKANRCILRLVPGIDLLIPDRRLVGGMDADQMVFQVRLTADLSAVPEGSKGHMALWIMFEYCGVLTIEPVHASIDMIPIKTMPPLAQIDAVADSTVPIVGDTMNGGGEGTGTPAGAGIFGNLLGSIWNGVSKLPGLISKGLRGVANWMTSPAAQGSRDMVGSFLGFNPGQNSPWQNQAAYWLGDQIRQYGAPPALQAPSGVRRGPIIEEVDDEPNKKGGRIIGKGKLGKFYV